MTGLELKRISRDLMSGKVEYRACCNGGNSDDIPCCVINIRRSVCSCVRVQTLHVLDNHVFKN
jgi:hypothetical protein